MFKKSIVVISILVCLAIYVAPLTAQEDGVKIIKGIVEEVDKDFSYVVLNGQRMIIDAEIKEFVNFEVGDEVELKTEKVGEDTIVLDYEYI